MKAFITNHKKKLPAVAAVLLLLGVWWITALITASPLLLPGPPRVFAGLLKILKSADFFPAVSATLLRGMLAFLISVLLGVTVGTVAGLHAGLNTFFKPLVVTVRSTPVISIILLGLIWFDTGTVPVFIGLLVMFPIIFANVGEGIKNTDPSLVEMARLFKVKPLRILSGVYFPSALPYFFSGASSALGIGWKAVIACEVLSQPRFAVGTGMQNAQTYLLVSEVLAWTIVAVLVGYCFEVLLGKLEKQAVKGRQP